MLAAVIGLGGCALDKQSAPPLAGPSELALSITLSVTPDILTQDGHSQSAIDIVARDANSQPVRGLTLRLDMTDPVSGAPIDFGTLSSRTVSTNGDGRSSATFTAPGPFSATGPDSVVVGISATAVNSNYANAHKTSIQLKLVRPGTPLGPPPSSTDLKASFVFSPGSPKAGSAVQFDASSSVGDIASFTWSFGDGSTGTGSTVSHTFNLEGDYTVVLTVTDSRGFSVHSDPVRVTISATKDPTAKFTVSPTTPIAGTVSNFNASESKADTGHVIANYDWDFGDGTPHASGVTVQHTYALPSAYNVTLVVTDDTGRTGVTTQTVTAATSNPTAVFTVQPNAPKTTDIISLDASNSSAVLGRVIVTYKWDFTGAFVGTASGSTTTVGPVGVTGTLTIKLTVTDSAGQVGILSKTITINP